MYKLWYRIRVVNRIMDVVFMALFIVLIYQMVLLGMYIFRPKYVSEWPEWSRLTSESHPDGTVIIDRMVNGQEETVVANSKESKISIDFVSKVRKRKSSDWKWNPYPWEIKYNDGVDMQFAGLSIVPLVHK